jgi:predicted DNA-binding ribbon-helix-helix protein
VALTQPSGQAEKKILKELEACALADGVAFGALLNQVRELEAGEALTKLEASALRAEVASLKQQQQQQRRAEPAAGGAVTSARGDADWLYLRNVILKYMETEDHHSMFPVVATLLHLTASEVTTVARAREERASQRVSKGWFG